MHLALPMLLAAILAGAGTYGVIARRNAVLVLIGVELILNAANVMLVALGAADSSPLQVGQSLTLFVITIAAAEICVALAVVLAMFRVVGHVDLTRVAAAETDGDGAIDGATDGATDGDTDAEADGAQPAPESGRESRR